MRRSPDVRHRPSFDFRIHQARARRSSALLVTAFVAMVTLISAAIGIGTSLAMNAFMGESVRVAIDPMMALMVAGGTAGVIGLASLYKLVTLGGDGARIAESLGAEEIFSTASNPYQKRYFNIVEEMAIASGLPRPRVFVLRNESGINAFAAGASPDRAAVAVTHGALAMLDRDELAGVVAHELAHIANSDTRLNGRLLSLVFGLVALTTIGRVVIEMVPRSGGRRSSSDKGNATAMLLVIGILLLVVGFLGMLAGRVLQAMVSRRRELLADATAVKFTRNPDGLSRALKKIGAASRGSRVSRPHAEEARHMFFASSQRSSFAGLLATHPPLDQRIKAIDPDFDPRTDALYNASEREIMRTNHRRVAGPWSSIEDTVV